MIQFNLLPDIKLEYIRMKRLKRLLISMSTLVAASSLMIALVLFGYVNFAQKGHMEDLDRDLTRDANKLTSTKDIDRIITVQNQLASLPALHEGKPAASRLFVYLSQVTPADTSVKSISLDFTTNLVTLSGNAKDLLGVNRYIDTLKFTTYTVEGTKESKKAFSKVLLAGFSAGAGGQPDETGALSQAGFQTTFEFDPTIFDNKTKVKLNVPNTITTRSQINNPQALFQSPVEEEEKN